jgi:hypothetical protein
VLRGTTVIRRIAPIIIVLSLVIGPISQSPPVTSATSPSTLIAELVTGTSRISTDGRFVVWDDWLREVSYSDVFASDLHTGEVIRLTEDPGRYHDTGADVSDGVVVWIEEDLSSECWGCSRVRGRNLVTGEEFFLGVDGYNQRNVSITGDWVVWMQSPQTGPWNTGSIMLQNVRAMSPAVATAYVDELHHAPIVTGDRVLWSEIDRSVPDDEQLRMYIRDIPDGETATILEGQGYLQFVAGGDLIAYEDYWSRESPVVVVLDLETLDTRELQIEGELAATDGQYLIAIEMARRPDGPFEYRLISHDLATGYRLLVDGPRITYDTDSTDYFEVSARNGIVTWVAGSEIHATTFSDLIPTTPRPDPGKTDPSWLYFPETGHYLSHGFKNFWLNSGGLPVFGYPLTREFDELVPDIGDRHTVQFTERQRFEYHPAYTGTPYETLLGRLGYEDAARRGLLFRHPAFLRTPGDIGFDSDTDFFPVFGHTLSGRFRTYWHSHGLDFGDPGISYRESLALFGYPISEEFVDPDTGLTTQYFERAIFEYHPDNPEPYKVLLRRLGAEELDRRGW